MTTPDSRVGAELRRLRVQSGMSLRKLGQQIAYSHVYLSQIERGERPATADVIRRCDTALGAGWQLAALVDGPDVDGDQADRIRRVSAGAVTVDATTLDILAVVLDHYRRLEDTVGAHAVWAPVYAQHGLALRLLASAPSGLRRQAADVAAQHARQAGWLAVATGRRGAPALFRQTSRLADEAGLDDLVAMARSYLGYLGALAGRPAVVIEASAVARAMPAYVGERAYDAHQEARGWAMRGDVRQVVRLLGVGRDLAAETAAYGGDVPPWQYYRTPAFFHLERGLVLATLARHGDRRHAQDAVGALTAGVSGIGEAGDWVGDYLISLAECQRRIGDMAGMRATVARVEGIAARTGRPDLAWRARTVGSC